MKQLFCVNIGVSDTSIFEPPKYLIKNEIGDLFCHICLLLFTFLCTLKKFWNGRGLNPKESFF